MKKRRNEIIDAGIEYTLQNRPMCICGDAFFEDMREMNRNKTYEEAAKWADKTMIEKACEWLKDELYDIEDNTQRGGFDIRSKCYFTSEDLIEHFKKAMEE